MKNHKITKGNKRPIKKLIALWVVLAMLVVPFASHVGQKQGSKAEGAAGTIPTSVTSSKQEIKKDINLSVWAEANGDIISGKGSDSVVLLNNAQIYKYKLMSVKWNNADLSSSDKVVIRHFQLDEMVPETEEVAGMPDDSSVIDITGIIGAGDYTGLDESGAYGIYIRKHAETEGQVEKYQLVYTIKIDYRASAFTAEDGIYYNGTLKQEGDYVGDSTIVLGNANVSPTFKNATLKYYIKEQTEAETADFTTVTNYTTVNNISASTYKGKKVYAYAALISNETTNRVLEYKSLGYVNVSNDTTAPTVTCDSVEYLDNATYKLISTDSTHYDSNNKIYYGVSSKYKYTLTVKDEATAYGEIASGIKTVTAKFTGSDEAVTITNSPLGSDTYIIELPSDKANGETIRVTVKDNIGHENYIDLTKIKYVSESITVSNIKFLEDGDYWDAESKKYIKEQKTLQIQLSSTTLIDDMRVVYTEDADSKVFESEECTSENERVNRTRKVTAKFEVPADVDLENSKLYSGLKIQVKKNGASTFVDVTGGAMADIIYDKDAPDVTLAKIQISKDGGTSWEADTNDWIAAIGTDVTTELNYKYRYVVTATDIGGSGVGKVYCNDMEMTYDADLDAYVRVVPELGAGQEYIGSIYAKDKAGNPSRRMSFRKIIGIDPELNFGGLEIKDANNNVVTSQFGHGNTKYVNEQHKLSISVSSAFEIEEVWLYGDGGYAKKATLPAQVKNEQTNNRYIVTVTFDLPENTDLNSVLNNMYLFAKDKHGATKYYPDYPGWGQRQYIGNILYDLNSPELIVSPTPDTIWRTSYSLGYTIQSGPTLDTPVEESPLMEVAYSFTDYNEDKNTNAPEISVNGTQTSVSGTLDIPESTSLDGTKVSFVATDKSGNSLSGVTSYRIRVDNTPPDIKELQVNGNSHPSKPFEGDVLITSKIQDNLTIKSAKMTIVGPGTSVTKELANNMDINPDPFSFTLNNLIGKKAQDGKYTITVDVADKAGNTAQKTISFTVDNTLPVVTAKIMSGTTASKRPGTNFDGTICDYFYSSNVGITLTYEDENITESDVIVTDNGNRLNLKWYKIEGSNKYQADYVATQEGPHTIQINATDGAGNQAVMKQVVFVKDSKEPTITAVVNGGMVYSESMGALDFSSTPSLTFSVNDANEDVSDFNYQLIKTAPDALPVTADYIKTDNRVFRYTDDADYEINVYAVDNAGNRSGTRNIKFRVDSSAPELSISGASSGTALDTAATLTFTMVEAFWRDASGTITITKKDGGGNVQSTEPIEVTPTGRTTSISHTFSESGEYTITFTAKDRAGHTSETAPYTIIIDKDKPVITLNGVKNNNKTTGEVKFEANINDNFFQTKSIVIDATRTYLDDTNKEKTENIKFTGYNASASPTIISDTFKDDGIYKIKITCKDAAGNQDVQEVSFTIDKSKPVIDSKVLGAYEGTLTGFAWDYDLNDIIYDLTVCNAHMYLNGSEYDGTSEVEDGAYEMKITAEDELGNYEEYTVNFMLDTKAPTFIVTGVEDGEVKNEQYTIDVSLQLDDDVLDSVSLNGSSVEITDNKATITVTKKGDYKLTMKAHDAAGNEAEKTISFTYGDKISWWIFLIIGIVCVAAVGGIIFVVARKKNNDK